MKYVPAYLKKGDTIGIVAPSGYMPIEKMQACIEILDSWGFSVKMGATTHSQSPNYFSGTDEERALDLQEMMDDKHINAILCARGGYGVSRIIDQLSFKKFRKHPKWIIGYSDITVLHAHLEANYQIASMHAPMANAFNDGETDNPYLRSFRETLEGKPAFYQCSPHHFNKKGKAKGVLVGGNLTLVAHLVGTPSDIETKGKILFLEDIGEYLYNIDRMFVQLKRNGKLDHLSGLVIGSFTESKDTERPFGKDAYGIISEHIKNADYPVCFGFPVGHVKENYALKVGMNYHLTVEEDKVSLEE